MLLAIFILSFFLDLSPGTECGELAVQKKKIEMATIEPASPQAGYPDDHPAMTEKGRAVRTLVEADLLDDRYETTQRGLKSRHVQLMALGGTIGTGELDRTQDICLKQC